MRKALKLEIARFARTIVEQQDRGASADEKLLQRHDLAPVAERALGQKANFRERVEHHARGFHALDLCEQGFRRFGELDFGWMKERIVGVGAESVRKR